MHKLRTLTEYKRKDGWRFVPLSSDSLDAFRARMATYKVAAAAHQVVQMKRAAK